MAEVLVSIVMDQLTLVTRTGETIGVCDMEVALLMDTLNKIRVVLDDAEKRQVGDREVHHWLQIFKNVLYEAGDVLDAWNTRFLRSQIQEDDIHANLGFLKKVCSYLFSPYSCLMSAVFSHRIGSKTREIASRVHWIYQMKPVRLVENLSAREIMDDEFGFISFPQQEQQLHTSSLLGEANILGRDIEVERILSCLLGESSHHEMHIPVISIVGMGGVGKTALAKVVWNQEKVITTFEMRIWVCVSQLFDLKSVAREIIQQATVEPVHDIYPLEALLSRLYTSVAAKRLLLVLDDVWISYPYEWNPLKLCLADGAPGSRILVTTRREDVAFTMDSTFILSLGTLSEEESWLLFKDAAFRGRESDLEFLEEIGRKLANKSNGLPLTIITLGRVMGFKRTMEEWREVLESDIWGTALMDDAFAPLLVSYLTLSSLTKQCFLFCAIFPNNMEIFKDDVIRLWMAQGFLGSGGSEELEFIGEECFYNLDAHNFFESSQTDSDGNITSCIMHNLVHEFGQFLTYEECSIVDTNSTKLTSTQVRHVTTRNMENPSIYSAKNLHTLLRPLDFRQSTFTVPIKLFRQLPCLRALDLSHGAFEELPSKIGSLLHLRYLDLSHTNLWKLPETVTNLCNLQTLRLNHCRRLQKLPEGIGKLSNLRHLEIKRTGDMLSLPQGLKKLSFLRTLNKFIVDGESHSCKIGELKPLNHIQGELKMMELGLVAENEAAEAELKKKNLRRLTLKFGYLRDGDAGRMEHVIEKLQPHDDLKELKIKSYLGSQFPSWIGSSSMLANLQTLELSKCQNCTELPALGKLASLEKLAVRQMRVKTIGHEFYGFDVASSSGAEIIAFPKLKMLRFCGMVDWEEWDLPLSAGRKVMPLISVITIEDCPKLRSIPPLGTIESLEDLFICKLQSVKHIGSEFYGAGVDSSGGEATAFPKLKKLKVTDMLELGHWEHPRLVGRKIMPCLCEVSLSNCPRLGALPGFGILESLESLEINNLSSVKHVGLELLGVNEPVASGELAEQVSIFPKLMKLFITNMQDWEEWNLPLLKDTEIMPLLCHLKIENCRKLKGIPFLGRTKSLESLRLIIG